MRSKHLAMMAVVILTASSACKNEESDDETPVQIPEPVQEFGPGQQDEYVPPTPIPGKPGEEVEGVTKSEAHASCPMAVQGAEVTATDLENGIALTFTTDDGDVAELRTRVLAMADMYEQHGRDPSQHAVIWHRLMMGDRGDPPRWARRRHHRAQGGHGPMPGTKATVTQLPDGARLVLEPSDVSQLTDLRLHVRAHQERMESGECWTLAD